MTMTEDKAHKWTDRRLAAMESRISHIYKEAQDEIDEKLKAFTEKFEKQSVEKQKAVETGKITADEFKRWTRTQVFISDEWKKARAMLADEYALANQTALAYINGETPEIYSVAYNAIKNEVESKIAGYSFHLLDKNTVKLLITENGLRLPPPTKKLDVAKDKRWNIKKINSELTQGILQGESVGKIADRFQKVTDMNRVAALRNARTMATCAENRGRMQSYSDLEKDGCTIEREWVAAIDSRTRHAHQVLDGQKRKEGEAFVYDGDEIMYPGDPTAKPYLVYNCRCTLAAEIIAYKGKDVRSSKYEAGKVGDDTENFEKKRKEAEERKKKSRELTSKEKRDIIRTGARIKDPDSEIAEEHAKRYYDFIRKSESQVPRIAKNTGYGEKELHEIEDYLFRNCSYYKEETAKWDFFAPDCAIAQSWQRLIDGKNIKPHDLTLLKHELCEMEIKRNEIDITHDEAHTRAQEKYNYRKESDAYYADLNKPKKRKQHN